jgi:hypothetical protein
LSDFSRLCSGRGGERVTRPLDWQGIGMLRSRGFWKVGALGRIQVLDKNGSDTDLIKCLPTAIRVLSSKCSGRAVMGGNPALAPDQQHPVKPTAVVPVHQSDATALAFTDFPGFHHNP